MKGGEKGREGERKERELQIKKRDSERGRGKDRKSKVGRE